MFRTFQLKIGLYYIERVDRGVGYGDKGGGGKGDGGKGGGGRGKRGRG